MFQERPMLLKQDEREKYLQSICKIVGETDIYSADRMISKTRLVWIDK